MDWMKVDPWFWQLATLLLGGAFVWLVKRTLDKGLDHWTETVQKLEKSIDKLISRDDAHEERINGHETRLTVVEKLIFHRRRTDGNEDALD